MWGKFKSYEAALKEVKRARDPYGKGRKVSSILRLKLRADDVIELYDCGAKFVEFWPDDTITVFFPGRVLPSTYSKIGIVVYRHRGKNAVIHQYGCYDVSLRKLENHIPAVDGLRFDHATGECLNAVAWPERHTDKEAARRWKSKIRTFKKGFQVALKVGAFDDLIGVDWQVDIVRNPYNMIGLSYAADFLMHLEASNFREMFRLVYARTNWWIKHDLHRASDFQKREKIIMQMFDNFYARHRDDIRKRAGCYIEDVPQLPQSDGLPYGTTDAASIGVA